MPVTIEKGQDVVLKIGGVLISATTSHSMEISSNMLDVTTKDSQEFYEEVIPSRKSWTMQVEGCYDPSGAYNAEELITAIDAGTEVSAMFGGVDTGDKVWTGTAYFEQVSMDAPMDERVTFSGTLRGSGPLDVQTLS